VLPLTKAQREGAITGQENRKHVQEEDGHQQMNPDLSQFKGTNED
jgi:hypothetical protein